MGSGKSTLGKKLAAKLNRNHVDTDALIEAKEGMTIPEIFNQKGEPYFRNCETQLITHLLTVENQVISVGGGFPCHDGLLEQLKICGLTIYLKYHPKTLVKRILESTGERPLIAGKSEAELQIYVSNLLRTRSVDYENCDLVLTGKEQRINALLAKIRASQ